MRVPTGFPLTSFVLVCLGAPVFSACLSREVATDAPIVKTDFVVSAAAPGADKVDLLFMIDNSTSMGDKQVLLEEAVPLLVKRLVTPTCVDAKGVPLASGEVAGNDGKCSHGTPEFPAVHDLHIGIVSSSIGDFGLSNGGVTNPGEFVCPANSAQLTTQNDHAHLLNRAPSGIGAAGEPPATTDAPNGFLAWYPGGNTGVAPAKPITQVATLDSDFTSLVGGVHQFGCGLEGQLESWYQFLVQPDPWVSIAVKGGNAKVAGTAQRVGIDTTTLKQRHDFLRPDSLVAVIGLSDEDDSTVDPGAFAAQSWIFNRKTGSPKATAACATDPNDPSCTSCSINPKAPGCSTDGNVSTYPNDDDPLGVRFQHMKQRFGFDPQYPISRYKSGLQDSMVPNRDGELHDANLRYAPKANCTNPLFAASLPDGTGFSADVATNPADADLAKTCLLPGGARSKKLVYFGFIGGVPWQLLTTNAKSATPTNSATVGFKSTLTDADWTSIIGKDPENYDFGGQDPHMVQSTTPRPNVPGVDAADDADPYNGRDFDTGGQDLEYACTFDLPAHDDGSVGTDCSDAAIDSDKAAGTSSPNDGLLQAICDCESPEKRAEQGLGGTRPLCSATQPTLQTRGKAYPTIREFSLVHDMGPNGIIASLCPRTLDKGDTANYGYNPAVDSIIGKIGAGLNVCPPFQLTKDASQQVPCEVIEQLPNGTCSAAGFTDATGPALSGFLAQQAAAGPEADAGASGALATSGGGAVCVVPQLVGDCTSSSNPGFCYVTPDDEPDDATVAACHGALRFSKTGLPDGATASLECLQSNAPAAATAASLADSGTRSTND